MTDHIDTGISHEACWAKTTEDDGLGISVRDRCFLQEQAVEESFNGLVLSESSLADDWLNKEEYEAWNNL